MRFSGIMIGSDNAKALGEFYTKFLGQPGYQEGDWYGWEEGAQLMIGSHSDVHGQSGTPARIIISVEVEDVAAAFTQLTEAGAGVVAEPYKPGGDGDDVWLATVSDPDGNYVQLARPWK